MTKSRYLKAKIDERLSTMPKATKPRRRPPSDSAATGRRVSTAPRSSSLCPDGIITDTVSICNLGGCTIDWEFEEVAASRGLEIVGTVTNKPQAGADVAPTSHLLAGPLALGDLLFELDFGAITADTQILGVEFDGTYYWVTGGNSGLDPNKLYKIDTAGTLIATYDQSSLAGWGWRDLAYDGTYLYASDSGTVQQIDPATGAVTCMGNTGDRFSGLTFDSAGRLFGITGTPSLPAACRRRFFHPGLSRGFPGEISCRGSAKWV